MTKPRSQEDSTVTLSQSAMTLQLVNCLFEFGVMMATRTMTLVVHATNKVPCVSYLNETFHFLQHEPGRSEREDSAIVILLLGWERDTVEKVRTTIVVVFQSVKQPLLWYLERALQNIERCHCNLHILLEPAVAKDWTQSRVWGESSVNSGISILSNFVFLSITI